MTNERQEARQSEPELDRFMLALKLPEYVQHHSDCAAFGYGPQHTACTCGLSPLLSQLSD